MKFILLASIGLGAGVAAAQGISDPQLTGTWSSKSNSVFTGPDFYDPATEKLTEPKHTGISYSFTDDGYYEVAYYRAIANPNDPSCPSAMMQWQHGTFEKLANGSVTLSPIKVDGRQLLSDPCNYDTSILTRYNQSELFQRYDIGPDSYHDGLLRLDIYQFNGAPMMPLYQASTSPKMLPTSTLHPTNKPTGTAGAAATTGSKAKRDLGDSYDQLPLNFNALHQPKAYQRADYWWWVGLVMTGVGGVLYFCV